VTWREALYQRLLVTGQFALLLALLWPLAPGPLWWMALPLLLAAAWLGVWALWVNRPGNFNIIPAVAPHARLITFGPYRLVRHPMYMSVLLWGAGCVLLHYDPRQLLLWCLLTGVLVLKIRCEERHLVRRFPGYIKVMARYRLMPKIW
jgi:protein-S-isoprenylcysteine O-methyltransferase Ste14